MGAYLQKDQISTLFVWVGAMGGGLGGGWSPKGVHTKIYTVRAPLFCICPPEQPFLTIAFTAGPTQASGT